MKINRDNYEEYFILYADNELKLAERKMVEEFVAIHIDLKEEFEMMLQMKLDPDDQMSFPDKNSLFKPIELQDDQYHPEPGQLDMLMYMDNELEEEERLKFEKKLKADKKIREELDIFLNARAEPDFKIVFPDKSLLYRHTEKSSPVIRITWVRVAIAAAVLLIAGLLWLNRDAGNDQEFAPLASVENTAKDTSKKVESTGSSKTDAPIENKSLANNKEDEKAIETSDANDQKQVAHNKNPDKHLKENAGKEPESKKSTNEKHSSQLAVNKVAPQHQLNSETKNSTSTQRNINRPEVKDNPAVSSSDIADNSRPDVTDQTADQSDAGFASNHNIKTNYATEALLRGDDDPAERTVEMMEEEKPRKGALRGIFRKANRILNKVTNPEQGPASVRVAGIEIASAQ